MHPIVLLCVLAAVEKCGHVLLCCEIVQVDALKKPVDLLDDWRKIRCIDAVLRKCIASYAKGRGGISMPVITYTYDHAHAKMTDSQGTIGWRGVLEGMILTEVLVIQ